MYETFKARFDEVLRNVRGEAREFVSYKKTCIPEGYNLL